MASKGWPWENTPDTDFLDPYFEQYFDQAYPRLEEHKRLEFDRKFFPSISELIETSREKDKSTFKHLIKIRHAFFRVLYTDDISSEKSSDSAEDKFEVGKGILGALDRECYMHLLELACDESETRRFLEKYPRLANILARGKETSPALYITVLQLRNYWIHQNRLNPPKKNNDQNGGSDG